MPRYWARLAGGEVLPYVWDSPTVHVLWNDPYGLYPAPAVDGTFEEIERRRRHPSRSPGPSGTEPYGVDPRLAAIHNGSVYDIAIVGGGIVGLATAHEILSRSPRRTVVVIEKEAELASHQTGHNSGVIHSGIYYRPGSLKARNCRDGVGRLIELCDRRGVAYELCGKVIVATDEDERTRLHGLLDRGRRNGVPGLRLIEPSELAEIEPHARGVEALVSPSTGIVRYAEVARALADGVRERDGVIQLRAEVLGYSEPTLHTSSGDIEARIVVGCAGLHADRVMQLCGGSSSMLIVGFRGEYYRLRESRRHLVRHLIYPVPDPRFPFLGVHFTRRVGGEVEAGPNAVLALAREGYTRGTVRGRDLYEMVRFPGFWRMGRRHWSTAVDEYHRSLSKKAFVRGLRRLVPEIESGDLVPGGAGVRAMALQADGTLVDDFRIERHERTLHVLSAPSPAATAALAIAAHVVDLLE